MNNSAAQIASLTPTHRGEAKRGSAITFFDDSENEAENQPKEEMNATLSEFKKTQAH